MKKSMTVRKRKKGTFKVRRMLPMWRMCLAGAGAENDYTILILKMDQSSCGRRNPRQNHLHGYWQQQNRAAWWSHLFPCAATPWACYPSIAITSLGGDRGGVRGDKQATVEVHPMAAQANRAAGVATGEDKQAQGRESRNQADGSYRKQKFWSEKGDRARARPRATCVCVKAWMGKRISFYVSERCVVAKYIWVSPLG